MVELQKDFLEILAKRCSSQFMFYGYLDYILFGSLGVLF